MPKFSARTFIRIVDPIDQSNIVLLQSLIFIIKKGEFQLSELLAPLELWNR